MDEEDELEFIESDLGDLIVNPNYNNELKDAEAKFKIYEDEYQRTQHEYCIDEINKLKELIEHIKTYVSPDAKPVLNLYIILIMLLHLLLLITFVKHMAFYIMHTTLIKYVS